MLLEDSLPNDKIFHKTSILVNKHELSVTNNKESKIPTSKQKTIQERDNSMKSLQNRDIKKDDYDHNHNYSSSDFLDISYHPTSITFDNTNRQQQECLNTASNDIKNTLENNSRERKSSLGELSSQLQEITTLNALCPPSHILKARRLSKNTIDSPVRSPTREIATPKPLVVTDNNNSAVSPRFMALRKLSEVSNLSSNSLSHSLVPPVSQIPSVYQQGNTPTGKDYASNTNYRLADPEFENRLLDKIDNIIKTQLGIYLDQTSWKASESHLDARRFWEDQKKEMFGFATTLIDRLEAQVDIQRQMTLESIHSPLLSTKSSEKGREDDFETTINALQSALNTYKAKYSEAQRELMELSTKYMMTEKQQQEDKCNMENTETNRQQKIKETSSTVDSLECQLVQMQETNTRLIEKAQAYEEALKKQNSELTLLKCKLAKAESLVHSKTRQKRKYVSITNEEDNVSIIDRRPPETKVSNHSWADIMESEDEAKKRIEEWESKYEELQSKYFDVCLKLEKNRKQSDNEIKIFNLNQSMIEKDKEIRHLKQMANVNKIQLKNLQLKVDNYQKMLIRSDKKDITEHIQTCQNRSGQRKAPIDNLLESTYITTNGYLTLITEINGHPSKYMIKIPNSSRHPQNGTFRKHRTTEKGNATTLNSNAAVWTKAGRNNKFY
ncbi:MAG: hypothetical protein EXX96DRAFT_85626 [Benjaminiella poitrasii]|nr:MAG: hypothetical protein EXX96DRAFT_85626 [Benjaminiella poitrasii]